MAVVVEISNTQHLAYSPLNEKHNILYNRARHIFNQRFIQKPWFDLNPFLDKADEEENNFENFVPDDFKGVQPLQSLCIVEDYFSSKPLLTKEFEIGQFWDYLFSSDWTEGHSVRVLEGQLHELIVSTLVRLIQSGNVVHHNTYAYARNKRPRTTSIFYAHSKEKKTDPNLGFTEETLLVEFIYYGHAVNRESDSSEGYAGSSTTFPYVSSVSEEIESSDQETLDTKNKTIDTAPHLPIKPHPPRNKSQQKRVRRRVHYTEDVKTTSGPKTSTDDVTLSRQAIGRSLSRHLEESGLPPIPRKGIPRKETLSNFSSGSDYRKAPPTVDLNQFICTEKIRYLGEFDLDSDNSSSEDEAESFGQEFYLGDIPASDKTESVEMILKKRKDMMAKLKSDQKKKTKEYKPPTSMLPQLSKLVVSKYISAVKLREAGQEEDTVPDLAEFIAMLKEDDKYDPTLGSLDRQKFIKVAKKYHLIKPDNERFADEVGGVTDSVSCKMHCYDRDETWRTLRDNTKRNYLATKLMNAGGKVIVKPKKKKKKEQQKKEVPLKVPVVFVTTSTGITYVHPVSKQLVQKQRREELQRLANAKTNSRRTSLLPKSPTALKQELEKKRRSLTNSVLDSIREKGGPMFPKAMPFRPGSESPDKDSDTESDELSDSPFDRKKLNINFSIEKIKLKRARQKRRKTETKTFHAVLQKYYRMQSVLKAFTPKPSTTGSSRRLSMPAYPSGFSPGIAAQSPIKRIRQLGLKEKDIKEVKDPITIGKLKKFRFLKAKEKSKPAEILHPEMPSFDVYPMHDFRINIERALAEFVVRREIVVSNISTKKSVSITFTKKSVFTKSKFSCN